MEYSTFRQTIWPLLLIILIAGSVYYYTYIYRPSPKHKDEMPIATAPASGCLYYSDDETGTRRSRLYAYNVAKQQQYELADDGAYDITPVPISQNQLLYLSSPYEPSDIVPFPYLDYHEVVMRDLINQTTTVISSTDISQRQALTWSDQNRHYAFMGLSSTGQEKYFVSGESVETPADWNVYIGDQNGTEQLIGSGFHPTWSGDGSALYYLTDQMVLRYDMASGNQDTVLQNQNWQIKKGTGFAISPDERRMVFTDESTATFILYERSSSETATWKLVNTFPIADASKTPFMPVFSPDNNYVAYYATAKSRSGEGGVYILNFATSEQQLLFPVKTVLPYGIQLEWGHSCPNG